MYYRAVNDVTAGPWFNNFLEAWAEGQAFPDFMYVEDENGNLWSAKDEFMGEED